MPNKKTKDDLLAEKVSAEKKLEQYTHQLQRAVNREKYLVKGEAKKRTHILCNIGGAVLSFWPEVQYLTKVEQYQIFEKLIGIVPSRMEGNKMALFHFHVDQIGRSAGRSAVACAAYRSGEKLYSEYYGETSDYTRKGGVMYSEIMLPPHAPMAYADRQTLWNAVEKAERRHDAQLAYSFDIALQNELTFEENLEVARAFLLQYFVGDGMTVDFCVHDPERDGIQNPHFHVMVPIRPLNPDGTWGAKQHRVYHLDENGERIRDEHGNYVFDAIATTDWGKPETLELWREQWANMVNAKFEQKGLSCRIDHRSYEDQALDILPTVHEGPMVRQMEQKGIRTEKGELNRWIKATNRILKNLKQRIADLKLWIEVLREELGKQQTSQDLVRLIQDYYGERNRGTLHLPAYARQKARVGNLKQLNETVNYLSEHKLFTVEDLRKEMEQMEDARHILQEGTREKQERIKALKELLRHAEAYEELKSLQEKLNIFKFKKRREQFKQEHESDFRRFYLAKRKLKEAVPDGEPPVDVWKNELSQLEQEYRQQSAQASLLWKESKKLRELQVLVDEVLRKQGQREREQQHSDRHQDKQEERLW